MHQAPGHPAAQQFSTQLVINDFRGDDKLIIADKSLEPGAAFLGSFGDIGIGHESQRAGIEQNDLFAGKSF